MATSNPNLLTQTRQWAKKAILIMLASSYGDDTAPTGAANWIEARNVSFTPMDVETAERNIEMPYLGNAGKIIVAKWAKLNFDVALAPSGTAGTAAKWGPLMLGCAMSQTIVATTSVIYNAVSSAYSSLTAFVVIDGVLHKLLGTRGSMKGKMSAKGIPLLSFSYDACFVAPVDGANPAVTRTGWMIEEGINSKNTGPAMINSIATAFSNFEWDLGVKTSRNDLPGPQREVGISGRSATASVTVLAPGSLAVFDPFALADTGINVPVSVTHGSVAGKKTKIDVQAVVTGVDYDNIDGQLAYKLALNLEPVAGNDEFTLTCL